MSKTVEPDGRPPEGFQSSRETRSLDATNLTPYELDHLAKTAKPRLEDYPPPDWNYLYYHSSVLAGFPLSSGRGARMMKIPAQATLFTRGDRKEAIFFVLSGELRLVRRTRSGREIVLQRTRHVFLAEASLFQLTYDCDALAAETSRLLAIRRKAFADALVVRDLRDNWIAHLARELRNSQTNPRPI